MRTARAVRLLRIVRLMLHLGRGLATAAFCFPFQTPARRRHEIRRWSARLLSILAVRLDVSGAIETSRPLMLVANHVSWLDIFAINAILPVRFIAKAEIRKWPLLGWLSARAGTMFIERARRRDTARIGAEMHAALQAADVFAVFPEGTTTDGSAVLAFHASLLAPALLARAAVQPIAIRYARPDGTLCVEAAYSGGKSLWGATLAIASQRVIVAHVSILPAIADTERHRRHIAAEARDAILRKLFPEGRRSRTARATDHPA